MKLEKPLAAGATALALIVGGGAGATTDARQGRNRPQALATLETAPRIDFPAPTDSNSPAYWLLFHGARRLVVVNSSPDPVISIGSALDALTVSLPAAYRSPRNGARWMEAIVPDDAGRLYGYYHNEPAGICGDEPLTAPRIGAARSLNGGRSWTDLGLVLEAPPGPPDCGTPNRYFAGGVGDFSVILNRDASDLYFLFSSYAAPLALQGVGVARMRWSDRDDPQGRVAVWDDGAWRDPAVLDEEWVYPAPTPIFPAATSWHQRRGVVDAFWGPSVHWNTAIERYVVLLNRASDAEWTQEGIYMSTTKTVEDPRSWSPPAQLVSGGEWYPQVMGLEPGIGTDKLAGQRARFFMGGSSRHEIVFDAPAVTAVPR